MIYDDHLRLRPQRTWELIRCPRCDWAVMSESDEIVDILLTIHIEMCGVADLEASPQGSV